MKLACEVWFWFAVANVIAAYLFLTFGEYPRSRSALDRWQDALSVMTNAGIAIYLYVVIWHP